MNATHSVSSSQECACWKPTLIALSLFLAIGVVAVKAQIPIIPIPQQLFAQPVPDFIGSPAVPNPITDATPLRHPHVR